MIVLHPLRSASLAYYLADPALELDGLRDGGPGWRLWGESLERVLVRPGRGRTYGFDVIVAAPRTVSLLVALDEGQAPHVVRAHRRAVASALHYLNTTAVGVRIRRDAQDWIRPSSWPSAWGFTHGVNRWGEPHLHDHVLVGARVDDGAPVLDTRLLFAHIRSADALYQAELRARVGETTTWRPWRSFRGRDHVASLDEGWRALWGGHSLERAPKRHWSRTETCAAWDDARRHFVAQGVVEPPTRHFDYHCLAAQLWRADGVGRRDLVAALAHAAVFGAHAGGVTRAVATRWPELRPGQLRERRMRDRDVLARVDRTELDPAHVLTAVEYEGPAVTTTRDLGRGEPGLLVTSSLDAPGAAPPSGRATRPFDQV